MGGSTVFSRAPDFQTKTQGLSSLEFENLFFGPRLGLAFSLGYHSAAATGIQGGYSYRGWQGMHFRLSGEIYLSPAPSPGAVGGPNFIRGPGSSGSGGGIRVRPGVGAGVGGFFSMYQYTEILFFYPSLRIQPFADLFLPRSLFSLRFALPVELYLRRDLDYSYSLGLGASGVFRWDAFMERRRRLGR